MFNQNTIQMKRFILMLIAMVLLAVPVLSQGDTPNVYDTIWDLLADAENVLVAIAGYVGAVVFLSAPLNKLLKIEGNWPKRIVSWIIAGILTTIANVANLFLLADASALQTAAYAIGIGLVANGFFTIPQVRTFLQYLKLEIKKE